MKTRRWGKTFSYICVVVLISCSRQSVNPFSCQEDNTHIPAPKDMEISGTLIYQNSDSTGLYALNGIPVLHSQILPDYTYSTVFGFSPDGEWLAYSPFEIRADGSYESMEIVLLSASGDMITNNLSTKDFESELQVGHQLIGISAFSYWVNSRTIYATLYSQNLDESTSGVISDSPKILNPFDGRWGNQYLDLPDRYPSGVIGMSPDMNWAVYEGNGLSLWDYDKKIKVWHDETLVAPFRALIYWSPDSSTVAYLSLYDTLNDHNLFLITRDGGVDTTLNDAKPISELEIRNISWSPDSRYLGLLGVENDELFILIYDMSSKRYIGQCMLAKSHGLFPSLIWSPDSSYIAVSDIDSPILLLDVSSGDIIELSQYGRVLGWSKKLFMSIK